MHFVKHCDVLGINGVLLLVLIGGVVRKLLVKLPEVVHVRLDAHV